MTDQPMPDPATLAQNAPIMMEPLALLQPAPIQPLTGDAMAPDGKQYVLDRYETPVGSFMFLLTPEQAIEHGEALARRGRAVSSGLVLPPNAKL